MFYFQHKIDVTIIINLQRTASLWFIAHYVHLTMIVTLLYIKNGTDHESSKERY